MTMWELAACADGIRKANGVEEPVGAMSDQEFSELKRSAGLLH